MIRGRVMAAEVLLPKLGMNMETATIVRWHKREGDPVAVGEILAEVETDKATIELEAETAGILRRCLVPAGQPVAVNAPIALIGSADEDIAPPASALPGRAPVPSHAERIYRAWQAPGEGAG